ncbi:hypothetical protein ABK046_51640, partial [Streptomyces caeruleatus]
MILVLAVLADRIASYIVAKPVKCIWKFKIKDDMVKTILMISDIVAWTAAINILLLFVFNV